MENKKCSVCGYGTADDTLKECPVCGGALEAQAGEDVQTQNSQIEVQEPVAQLAETPEETPEVAVQADDTLEEILEEAPKADKKVKIITACVAGVLVLALGIFGWYFFAGKDNVKDMAFQDIEGLFHNQDDSNYFEFKIEETKVDVILEDSSAASSAEAVSDSAASSDGAKAPEQKTETVTFDGTYKSGYTLEYVQRILAQEYVMRNELSEEYQKYRKEKKLILDDYLGFVKGEKGVSQSELDAIDKEAQYSAQRLQYDQSGYWNYNEETKEVEIYDNTGKNLESTLKISGDTLVNPEGFFTGKYAANKSRSVLKYSGEGISEELILYEDGNFIIKLEYEGQESQSVAGEYEANEEYVVLSINGQRVPHVKVKGGLASYAYAKHTEEK
ncbi:MAG: hypothetical protein IKJ68_06665 [Clostridia bacterium]|nr:hypothetical protein [Clostridia bacterium]